MEEIEHLKSQSFKLQNCPSPMPVPNATTTDKNDHALSHYSSISSSLELKPKRALSNLQQLEAQLFSSRSYSMSLLLSWLKGIAFSRSSSSLRKKLGASSIFSRSISSTISQQLKRVVSGQRHSLISVSAVIFLVRMVKSATFCNRSHAEAFLLGFSRGGGELRKWWMIQKGSRGDYWGVYACMPHLIILITYFQERLYRLAKNSGQTLPPTRPHPPLPCPPHANNKTEHQRDESLIFSNSYRAGQFGEGGKDGEEGR